MDTLNVSCVFDTCAFGVKRKSQIASRSRFQLTNLSPHMYLQCSNKSSRFHKAIPTTSQGFA